MPFVHGQSEASKSTRHQATLHSRGSGILHRTRRCLRLTTALLTSIDYLGTLLFQDNKGIIRLQKQLGQSHYRSISLHHDFSRRASLILLDRSLNSFMPSLDSLSPDENALMAVVVVISSIDLQQQPGIAEDIGRDEIVLNSEFQCWLFILS